MSRLELCSALREHIELATSARDMYRESIQKAKDALIQCQPNSPPSFEHFTFDFAQQACIPHRAREVGALYFKVPRRIQIFGVAAEAVPEQVNYLIDENQTIGKDGSKSHGPNSVVSMLHYHLHHHSKGSPVICLHADNCCGQNKNRTVLAYLCWRVLVGLNTDIDLLFMRVGHTRCFVDGGFGFVKQKFRKSDVDTVAQLATVVNDSVGFNKAETYQWRWREWDAHLGKYFSALKNITKFQRFRFSSQFLGKVEASESTSLPNATVTLLKPNVPDNVLLASTLPAVLEPAGMSATRSDYLYKNIRQHCHEESQDITCPAPEDPTVAIED